MTPHLEPWHLVLLALSILGGYWALAKIIGAQFQRGLNDGQAVTYDLERDRNGRESATNLALA